MFEYINQGFYLLSGIVIFISVIAMVMHYHENKNKEDRHNIAIFPLVMIIFAIGAPLYISYQNKVLIDENMRLFKIGHALECGNGFKLLIVSKDRDWEIIKKDSFTKNDLIIRADSCELNKEIVR